MIAGSYGHDRWKAGAGGCTYTFAAPSGPSNSITITAGTLQQVIEGASLAGGTYTLSWTGTAQGRIGAGSYAASPVTGSVTAGANTTIEFNTGTLSRVKFELGSVATPWVALSPQQQLAACQRYYQVQPAVYVAGYAPAANNVINTLAYPVPMRAAPTVAYASASGANASALFAYNTTSSNVALAATITATGWGYATATVLLSADL